MDEERDDLEPCPLCRTPMVPIAYGYPTGETFEAAERGEVVLGGCMVWDGRPTRQCPRCRYAADRRHDEAPF